MARNNALTDIPMTLAICVHEVLEGLPLRTSFPPAPKDRIGLRPHRSAAYHRPDKEILR